MLAGRVTTHWAPGLGHRYMYRQAEGGGGGRGGLGYVLSFVGRRMWCRFDDAHGVNECAVLHKPADLDCWGDLEMHVAAAWWLFLGATGACGRHVHLASQ